MWSVWLYNTLPHYLIITQCLREEKVTEHIMCVLIFSTILSEILLILCRTQQHFIISVCKCSCKVTIIPVQILMNLEFLAEFSKNSQIPNSIKIHPVGSELFHADRQMELIFAFENSANAPNKNRGTSFYQCNKHSNSKAQEVCICQKNPRQLQC